MSDTWTFLSMRHEKWLKYGVAKQFWFCFEIITEKCTEVQVELSTKVLGAYNSVPSYPMNLFFEFFEENI